MRRTQRECCPHRNDQLYHACRESYLRHTPKLLQPMLVRTRIVRVCGRWRYGVCGMIAFFMADFVYHKGRAK